MTLSPIKATRLTINSGFQGGGMSRALDESGGSTVVLEQLLTDPGQSTGAVGQLQADDAGDDQAD